MPKLTEALQKKNVELHADERSFAAAESDTALNRALIQACGGGRLGKRIFRLYDLRKNSCICR